MIEFQDYWWVSHNQTFDSEIMGYLWSPKLNRARRVNHFYENMRLAQVGDAVFSFADSQIKAVGIIQQPAVTRDRPAEFGEIGEQWDQDGWYIEVEWILLNTPFRPKDYIETLRPLLPPIYSPLQQNGNGNQGTYLANLGQNLGKRLLEIASELNPRLEPALESTAKDIEVIEDLSEIEQVEIPVTERLQLAKARIGQGLFRRRLEQIESRCRITGATDLRILNASHIKPWKMSTNQERLNGNNGLLLSVHIDRLFDRGLISFSNEGQVLVKDDSVRRIFANWNLDEARNVGGFNRQQCEYLEYHRVANGFVVP